MSVALYPGSFDPVHNGHIAVFKTAASLFDRLIVAAGHNPAKPSGLFSPDERVQFLRSATADLSNVEVKLFDGLVTKAANEFGADCLIKGLRGGADFDSEMQQAHMNLATGGVPTLFIPGLGPAAMIGGRYVREIGLMGGDVSAVVPADVAARLTEMQGSS